jgi:multicomponent Na+:H+ antiporter subunit G
MSPDGVLDVVTALCLVAGALLSLAAGVALVRFPDLLSRMHAATKPQVLGLLLVLLGCGLQLRNTVDITTLLLVAVFQLGTAPVAAHMIGRAGYRAGLAHHDVLLLDDLADRAELVDDPGPAHRVGQLPRTASEVPITTIRVTRHLRGADDEPPRRRA